LSNLLAKTFMKRIAIAINVERKLVITYYTGIPMFDLLVELIELVDSNMNLY